MLPNHAWTLCSLLAVFQHQRMTSTVVKFARLAFADAQRPASMFQCGAIHVGSVLVGPQDVSICLQTANSR